jgi:hypothetical protein
VFAAREAARAARRDHGVPREDQSGDGGQGIARYLVKARLSGMAEYRQLLGSTLQKIPVPAQSNSYVVMEEIKESFVLKVKQR